MFAMSREWLEDLLNSMGRGSRKQLAEHMRVQASAVSRIVRGERDISMAEFSRINEFFGGKLDMKQLSAEYREMAVDESAPREPLGVTFVGDVAAGSWKSPEEADEPRRAAFFVPPDPRFPEHFQCVYIVRGRSVERVARDGEALLCITLEAIEPKDGDIVIAERKQDQGGLIERTAKRLRIYRGRSELVPEYLDHTLNKPIELGEPGETGDVRIIAVALYVINPLRLGSNPCDCLRLLRCGIIVLANFANCLLRFPCDKRKFCPSPHGDGQ